MSDNFIFTPEAASDLLAVNDYIALKASPATAQRVINKIYSELAKLGDMPGMGHFREELLDRRFKFWSVFSYVIVYRWEVSPIEVVNVLHGARDLKSYFRR